MARQNSNKTPIIAPVNCGYHGMPKKEDCVFAYNNLYKEDDKSDNPFTPDVQTNLKNLSNIRRSFKIKDPNNMESLGYKNLHLLTFKERHCKDQEPRLVYEVKHAGERYFLNTGLYAGFLNVGGIKIEINTGYNEVLLQRMLNVANNIYLNNTGEKFKDMKTDNMLSTILGFLFLTSFKAAFAMGIPSGYVTVKERGFNVKGRFDVNKYIRKDMYGDGKISYSYKQREFVQDIIDVLYAAMTVLEKTGQFKSADLEKNYRQLRQLRSGNKVTHETIRRIGRHKSLNNPMYSRYKKALFYAKYILELKDVIHDEDSGKDGLSGFLIDIAQLWEIYLENLLKKRLEPNRYTIEAQEELHLYRGTFFSRANYPDLVIKNADGTPSAVIDAKFKTMKFRRDDVDRTDLFQIHSYTGYYNEINRKAPLKFCSLVYPAVKDPGGDIKTDSPLYGEDGLETRFFIGYIKVGSTFDEIVKNENEFLDRIEELLKD